MEFNNDSQLDSSQISDRRGIPGGRVALGGGSLGLVGIIITLALTLTGNGDVLNELNTLQNQQIDGVSQPAGELSECKTGADANAKEDCRIVGYVNSIQTYWQGAYPSYTKSKTVFFNNPTQTGCGVATSDVGPFYCPSDQQVYIDLGFYEELHSRFGATVGPSAQAYVLAHEYGHHVQDLQGVFSRVDSNDTGPQGSAVRSELQADCYAGVWANNASKTGYLKPLTQADVTDALNAASAIGDDRIQSQATGHVDRESWTHGSSEQRVRWFQTGYQSGNPGSCNTFAGSV